MVNIVNRSTFLLSGERREISVNLFNFASPILRIWDDKPRRQGIVNSKPVKCQCVATRQMDPPDEFHHPFHPYQIQRDFMRDLYSAIESKAVGIFESPTGTV